MIIKFALVPLSRIIDKLLNKCSFKSKDKKCCITRHDTSYRETYKSGHVKYLHNLVDLATEGLAHQCLVVTVVENSKTYIYLNNEWVVYAYTDEKISMMDVEEGTTTMVNNSKYVYLNNKWIQMEIPIEDFEY